MTVNTSGAAAAWGAHRHPDPLGPRTPQALGRGNCVRVRVVSRALRDCLPSYAVPGSAFVPGSLGSVQHAILSDPPLCKRWVEISYPKPLIPETFDTRIMRCLRPLYPRPILELDRPCAPQALGGEGAKPLYPKPLIPEALTRSP